MKKHKQHKKNKHIILKIVFIIIILQLILMSGVFSAYLFKSEGDFSKATLNIVSDVVGPMEPVIALILGVSDDSATKLADTIILAGYNPNNQKAFILSIPRDTFVGTKEKKYSSKNKINSLYSPGCYEIKKQVENMLGVTIDYYAVIRTKALRECVNIIGGVYYNVPINMNYDDTTQNLHIHLKSGYQKLDGKSAEKLLRFRHNNNGTSYSTQYGDNDFGRMRTQREFIKEVSKQIINIKNITKVKSIAVSISKNLETDISLKNVFLYIPFIMEFNTENIIMEQLPGISKKMDKIWFFEYDDKESKLLIEKLNNYLEI